MRNNSAKRKLAAGKPVSVVAPTYSSGGLVELLGRTGYDVIFIDCEHGPRAGTRSRTWYGRPSCATSRRSSGCRATTRPRSRAPSTAAPAACRSAHQHAGRGGGGRPSRQVLPHRTPGLRGRPGGVRREDARLHAPRERGDDGRRHAGGSRGAPQPRRHPEDPAHRRLLRRPRRPRPVDGPPGPDGPPRGEGRHGRRDQADPRGRQGAGRARRRPPSGTTSTSARCSSTWGSPRSSRPERRSSWARSRAPDRNRRPGRVSRTQRKEPHDDTASASDRRGRGPPGRAGGGAPRPGGGRPVRPRAQDRGAEGLLRDRPRGRRQPRPVRADAGRARARQGGHHRRRAEPARARSTCRPTARRSRSSSARGRRRWRRASRRRGRRCSTRRPPRRARRRPRRASSS